MDEHTPNASPEQRGQQRAAVSTPSKGRRGWGRLVWIAVVLIVLVLVVMALLRPHAKTGAGPGRHHGAGAASVADQPEPVAVTTVTRGEMPIILHEMGTVVPITNVALQARVSGYLTQVLYTEGQHVKKGDLLEVIDPRPYQAIVDQYEGQLAHDRAVLEEARIDSGRYQKLIAQSSISAQQARDQQFVVEQDEGQVKTDEGILAQNKLNVEYCYIHAPVDGRVGIRGVDMGNYVTAGSTQLTVLTQMEPMSVIYNVPQNQLGQVADRLRAQGSLPVSAWNGDDSSKIADGTVATLDSQADTATGNVRMRAIFPNADEHLFPNQFVNAHLLVNTLQNVLLLPTNALQTGPNGQFVYVVQANNTVKMQPVTVGASNNDHAVIESGVAEGDRVVTDGTNHLRPGAKVTVQADTLGGATPADDQSSVKHHHRTADQSSGDANTPSNAQSGTHP